MKGALLGAVLMLAAALPVSSPVVRGYPTSAPPGGVALDLTPDRLRGRVGSTRPRSPGTRQKRRRKLARRRR